MKAARLSANGATAKMRCLLIGQVQGNKIWMADACEKGVTEIKNKSILVFLCVSLLAIFIWSAIKPRDLFTWSLEVFPAIIGVALLALTYNKFRFTMLVYLLFRCIA